MSAPSKAFWLAGIAMAGLVFWSGWLVWISPAFAYELPLQEKPVLLFVAVQMSAGVVYLLALWALWRLPPSAMLVMAVLGVGLLMRLTQLGGVPILEDDFYRYLWDGAVTAHGHNPYQPIPQALQSTSPAASPAMATLAAEAGQTLERVNHPWLRTIYPPTAQVAFAAAYLLVPFDILGLRLIWLALDLAIAGLLLVMLRRARAPAFALSIYWLNPLLVKEVFNAGHMELVLVLMLLVTLMLSLRERRTAASFFLALAAGAKVWPVLWLPLLLRRSRTKVQALLAMLVFGAITLTMALPILLARLSASSGFTAYAQRWQINDSAYLLLHESAKWISESHAHTLARAMVMLVLLVLIAWRLWRYRPDITWLIHSLLVVTAALFLLSPTQFPWYYLWVLPLLVFCPMWSLLALTVTLPLYYLRFHFQVTQQVAWFDYGVVWIQFVPIWLLLVWEVARRHTRVCLEPPLETQP